jgi:RHS repeat-associated protein
MKRLALLLSFAFFPSALWAHGVSSPARPLPALQAPFAPPLQVTAAASEPSLFAALVPPASAWPREPIGTFADPFSVSKRFTGKGRDSSTALDYFGARYFSSPQGRFMSPDPALDIAASIASPQRWNKYSYVSNNPIAKVDPDGRNEAASQMMRPLALQMVPPEVRVSAEIQQQIEVKAGLVAGGLVASVIADTPGDVATALYDAYQGFKTGEWGDFKLDMLAMALPMVPAGAKNLLGKLDDVADAGKGAVRMEQAVSDAAAHVGGAGVMETTGRGTNFQFRSTTTNALGETETRIGRFDINPSDPHVQKSGPHLNLETQVNGRTTTNPHVPIDPRTIRPGDHP